MFTKFFVQHLLYVMLTLDTLVQQNYLLVLYLRIITEMLYIFCSPSISLKKSSKAVLPMTGFESLHNTRILLVKREVIIRINFSKIRSCLTKQFEEKNCLSNLILVQAAQAFTNLTCKPRRGEKFSDTLESI